MDEEQVKLDVQAVMDEVDNMGESVSESLTVAVQKLAQTVGLSE